MFSHCRDWEMFYTYLQGRAIRYNYSIMQTHYEYLQHHFSLPPKESAELCVQGTLRNQNLRTA